ncbi:MAG: acyltransferase [Hyphomonadaceae bacterium]|nr:acyltransferase [Hyphomonadaceae bacterium]
MSIETPPKVLRLQNIQALRGIAALLVAFSHLLIIERKYSNDQVLGQWIELGMVGVDLFFVISGFIMVHVAWSFRRGLKAVSEFLFARATRIYPLYWLITAVTFAVWLWRPEIVFSSMADQPDMLKSVLLIPDDHLPFFAIGWTLIHEMFFYLVFALALVFKPKFMLPFLALWAVVLGFGIYNGWDGPSPLLEILFNPLSFEFLFGAFSAWILKMYNAPLAKTALALGIVASITCLALALDRHDGMPATFADRALLFTVPCTLIVYGLSAIEIHGKTLSNALSKLGDWSYSLYLTHIMSLSLIGRVWRKIEQPGNLDNIIVLAFMPIFAIFVSWLCYRFAEKPMLNAAKKARGKLFPRPT